VCRDAYSIANKSTRAHNKLHAPASPALLSRIQTPKCPECVCLAIKKVQPVQSRRQARDVRGTRGTRGTVDAAATGPSEMHCMKKRGTSDGSAACIGADADAWGQASQPASHPASLTATPDALSRSRIRDAVRHSRERTNRPQDPRDLDPGTRLLMHEFTNSGFCVKRVWSPKGCGG
jgi:hypothetical protein